MTGLARYRWSLMLAALAAVFTAGIAATQGVSPVAGAWRAVVSFALVWTFQWSIITAWEILGEEAPAPEKVRVRRDGV